MDFVFKDGYESRPPFLTPGGGHPEPGQAPYTNQRVGGSCNYERCATGNLSTKTLPGDGEQFRSADPSEGVAFRQPL